MKKTYDLPVVCITEFKGEDIIMISGATGTQEDLEALSLDFGE